jgi:hypothetical protein
MGAVATRQNVHTDTCDVCVTQYGFEDKKSLNLIVRFLTSVMAFE